MPLGGLIILCICIIIVLFIVYIHKKKEPFINPVAVSNLFMNPDEIFLVAPNPSTFKINDNPDKFNYSGTGFTYSEASKACRSLGPDVQLADLNTVQNTSPSGLSLQVALGLSANWCAAGWTTSSSTIAYFPVGDLSDANRCKLSRTNTNFNLPTNSTGLPIVGIGSYTPTDGKAFAICVGPKPPLPTAKVNPFNTSSYSMYNNTMMTYIKTGVDANNPYNYDIFPVAFTDTQAYFALKNPTNSATTGRNPISFNKEDARATLKAKYGADTSSTTSNALNGPLLDNINAPTEATFSSVAAPGQPDAWASDSINKSCDLLSTVYTTMDNNLSTLASLFRDLSGNVNNIIKAKQENGVLQTTIQNVCLLPNLVTTAPMKSAACSRLLSLDYDILYRNKSSDSYSQSNTITDLESLNYALRLREVEIQQSLGSLQEILNSLKSENPSSPNVCDNTLSALTTKYKSNIVTIPASGSTPSYTKAINSSIYFDSNGNYSETPTRYAAPSSAFKIGREIEYNPVDNLKVKLEEISPFFSGSQYASLVSDVLNQLSVTLRTPFIDYTDISGVANVTNVNLRTINSMFPALT
jgi:hypothetical protein